MVERYGEMTEENPDWSRIILTLKRELNYTDYRLAIEVGMSESGLIQLKNAHAGNRHFTPRAKLLNLFEKVTNARKRT